MRQLILFLCNWSITVTALAGPPLTGDAAALFQQATKGRHFQVATQLKPAITPTSDGRSFFVTWAPEKVPDHWIVSIPGTRGFATDDLAIWSQNLKGRHVGLICLQWWLGSGDRTDSYYTPEEMYREIDLYLTSLQIAPGTVMFHGFSRGSANAYAVVALDAGRGRKYFSLAVASSGGVGLEYPPTRAITEGLYGDQPLKDTRWITVAGARDPHPDRDGIPGMRHAATWLKDQGATIIATIEDPQSGHGALQTNPKNAARVMDLFWDKKK